MKVLILADEMAEYVMFILGARCASGNLNLEELQTAADLQRQLAGAKTVDFSNLGPADLEAIGPGGIKMGIGAAKAPGVICTTCHATPCNCITTYRDSGHPDQPLETKVPSCQLPIGADDVCGQPEESRVHHRTNPNGHGFVWAGQKVPAEDLPHYHPS